MTVKIYPQRAQCSGCLLQYKRLAVTHKLNCVFYIFPAAEL